MTATWAVGASALDSSDDLREMGVRPPIREYLRLLWRRRHFLGAESKAKATSDTQDTYLGNVWLVLNPISWVCPST
jgi:teichoic acid transport system permease protein